MGKQTPQERCALPVRSLNHISRVCRDVEKSMQFYKSILGFIEIQRPAFEFEGAWLFNYGVGIHLIRGEPTPRPSKINPRADHLSFQADSLREVEDQLQQLSIPYVTDSVMEGGIKITQIFLHDPDDHMIEICNCDCWPLLPLSPRVSTPHSMMPGIGCPITNPSAGSIFAQQQAISAPSAA